MPRQTKTGLDKGAAHAILTLPNKPIWGISVHSRIVSPPVRDDDGNIITPARYKESGEPITQITEMA
jgi:hypothetical protein